MKPLLAPALSVLLAAGWVYWLGAWWCARKYFARRKKTFAATGQAEGSPRASFLPAVSILKPVKGLDAHVWENFVSFCGQDYPDFEILFGVADSSDPVVGLIRRLQAQFPNVTIRLFIGAGAGANPKAALLSRLEAHASGTVLVVSDSDIRVESDYLRRVVAPLRDPEIGLVTCPYRGVMPESLPARLEALYLNVTFLPAVIVADSLNAIVGLGATMAFRKFDLESVGGYRGMADHLMDDYQLALAIRGRGLRIHLSEYVTSSVLGQTRLLDQWAREVRWSRGIRTVSRSGYPGILLTFIIPGAIGLWIACGQSAPATAALALSVLMRWAVAWRISASLGEARRRRWLIWLPIRDCLSFLVWCTGLFGSHVSWRGQRYRIGRRGALQPVAPAGEWSRVAIRGLDAWLRRRQRIFEFSTHPRCLLRISRASCDRDIHLADGTELAPGDSVGELHLFNDHLPRIAASGPGVAWAISTQRRLHESLQLLARAALVDPRLQGVRAFRGTSRFAPRGGRAQLERLLARVHFQIQDTAPRNLLSRVHDHFENYLVVMLIWAFNPRGLHGSLHRQRHVLWISRRSLLRHFGPDRAPPRSRGDAALEFRQAPGHVLADEIATIRVNEVAGSESKSRRKRRRKLLLGRTGRI